MVNLCTLNLSHNKLTSVKGIKDCKSLKSLDVANNLIPNTGELAELLELPNLLCLDLKKNDISDHENVI